MQPLRMALHFWKIADMPLWNCAISVMEDRKIENNRKSSLIDRDIQRTIMKWSQRMILYPPRFITFLQKKEKSSIFSISISGSSTFESNILKKSSSRSAGWLYNYCIKVQGGIIADFFPIVPPCLPRK